MTINSMQLNNGTPISGLGTQTFNVPTTGLYTLRYVTFLPYLAAGSPAVTAQPSANSDNITVVADSSGSLNSTFFTFGTAGDLYLYYVWFNINSSGVDPAVAGRTGIQVVGATNVTANNLATATRAAIAAAVPNYVTVTGATSHVIITQNTSGLSTAAANGTATPGFSYVNTAGSYGTPAASGVNVIVKNNSTFLLQNGWPTPTQPTLGGGVTFAATAGDVVTFITSSLSTADAALNAVKSVVYIFQGE